MNKYLTQKVWKMRRNVKTLDGTPLVTLEYVENNVYQLLFLSCGCNRACTFCNYGFDYELTLEKVKPELEKIRLDKDIRELELEANGSFLDEREIPHELFIEIMHFVAHKNIPSITMETYYDTITEDKLKDIRRILGKEQCVNLELGFESASNNVRKVYNKDIDIAEYLEVASLCQKYEIGLYINVLLGAPFLTREEQIKDCLDSLDFIYGNMPKGTHVVLFPINIKENTMLKYWQDIGVYSQITSWEFVELLHRIPEKYLDKLTIAWWGQRENACTPGKIQHPRTCSKCHNRLMNFYKEFYCDWDPVKRKKAIEDIWASRCRCDKG